MNSRFLSLIVSVVVALAPVAAFGGDPPSVGAVYVMSNDAEGNQVIVFERDVHGRLTLADSYPTQGLGTGGDIDPLGSQGSLILSADHRWLIAVNAGSDDIAVFRVLKHGLELIGNFASRGASPVSLALHRDLLYVLNAGRDSVGPSIAGFIVNRDGELTPLAGSTRSLGPGGFHQVDFNPRGDTLVVTQGDPTGVNAILVFGVDKDGLPGAAPTVSPSFGLVPFGFIFDQRGHLLVSEAGSGAVSSYEILDDNTLEIIDGSVPNGNNATCWIAGTWFGVVFTANTGSNNLSSYKVKIATGELSVWDVNAAHGDKPIDMTITTSGQFLYVVNANSGTVGAFSISPFGGLTDLGSVAGLPLLHAQGIAAR